VAHNGGPQGIFIMQLSWFLEGATTGSNSLLIAIDTWPFHIGREAHCELPVAAKDISRRHARIDHCTDGGLQVTDLGSTNGTFVNRERLDKNAHVRLKDGDILHFGTSEFRLKSQPQRANPPGPNAQDMNHTVMFDRDRVLPERFAIQEREFLDMLQYKLLTVALQPIVAFDSRHIMAYEVLGRGNHPALSQAPIRLLGLAALLGKEVELSQAFRLAAAHAVAKMSGPVRLFMNIHPLEMFTEELYANLLLIRSMAPNMELVIEVHETAVAEVDKMKTMAQRLKQMGIEFAYDDFGAGQSRLNELAEVPPHVVKFDMSLIRDIDTATPKKQHMVAQLVQLVGSIGAVALAEGVETEAEAAFCHSIGFQLCQGYLTGKPALV
jgi:EAL domain-containing protein (putative c-di-GMP-specific phosphodiesterase class I)